MAVNKRTIHSTTQPEQTHQFLKAEYAVARALAEADSQLEAAHLVLQALCEALEWQLGEFWIIDSEANVLYCLDIWHVPTIEATEFIKLSRDLTFTSGVGLPGSIWQSGETAWIADTRQDKNFPRIIAASKDGLYSATGFPVLIGQQV